MERALIYQLALETGLRAGEIRRLEVRHLDLDAKQPTVTIEAGSAKNRRGASGVSSKTEVGQAQA